MPDWSKFTDEVRASTPARGPRCSVGIMLDELPEEGRRAVEAALANRLLTHTGIRQALVKRLGKETPSVFSISNHRRRGCKCGEIASIQVRS